MPLFLLTVSAVIFLCVLLNKVSSRLGIPMLLAFIVLGMVFGSDGLFKISFTNYAVAEQLCSTALIFIMFYGGFGTKWSAAKPVAVQSFLLSTAGGGFFAVFIAPLFFFLRKKAVRLIKNSTFDTIIPCTSTVLFRKQENTAMEKITNVPEVKLGIIAVSRDCFVISLSERRRKAIVESFSQYGTIYEAKTTVENEADMLKAVDEVKQAGCNALCVFLGNFGPETPETLIAKEFAGPVLYAAAAEERAVDGGRPAP